MCNTGFIYCTKSADTQSSNFGMKERNESQRCLGQKFEGLPTYLQAGDHIIRECKRSLRVCVCEYFWFLTKAFPSWGKFIKFDVASQTPEALIWTKFGLCLLRQWNTRQTSPQTQTSRKALFRRSLANFGKNMHQWYQCTKPKWSRESCG